MATNLNDWKSVNKMIYGLGILSIFTTPCNLIGEYLESLPQVKLSGPTVDTCNVLSDTFWPFFPRTNFSSHSGFGHHYNSLTLGNWPFNEIRYSDHEFDGNKMDGLVDEICAWGVFSKNNDYSEFGSKGCINRKEHFSQFPSDFQEADQLLRVKKAEYFDLCRGYYWEKVKGKD